jgi:hypothetical protein
VGVHSSTQTVDANVGGSIVEGYRTPTRKERKLSTKAKSGTESKATVNNPPMGSREGLFIGEVNGLITIP